MPDHANGNGRFRPQFNAGISLGNLLNLVAIVAAVVLWFGDIKATVAVIQAEIVHLKQAVAKIETVLDAKADKPAREFR
jgi:hypothetical protein